MYWQRSAANGGPLLYIWGSWRRSQGVPVQRNEVRDQSERPGQRQEIWPGGILALSANDDTPGTGVLWATVATSGNASDNPPAPGELLAFDAANVSQELWNSSMNASRDGFGNFAKFVPPLVVNGRVYVATQSNQVAVYGLLSSYTASPTSLAFGNEMTNVASTPKPVTVTNTGTWRCRSPASQSRPRVHSRSRRPITAAPRSRRVDCTINVVFEPDRGGIGRPRRSSVNAGNGAATQTVGARRHRCRADLHGARRPRSRSATNRRTSRVRRKPVTVTNSGAAALPITSITLSTRAPSRSRRPIPAALRSRPARTARSASSSIRPRPDRPRRR